MGVCARIWKVGPRFLRALVFYTTKGDMRMIGMNMTDAERIIWSADVDWPQLKEVVDCGALPKGTGIKLGRRFFEEDGHKKKAITYCQDAGYPVFADVKLDEIPDNVIDIAKMYLKYKPWMINVMAGACSTRAVDAENPKKNDALKRFADACNEVGTKSCAVTVLTSKSEDTCIWEFGQKSVEQVLKYVRLMTMCGMTDIVCSPLEAAAIRKNPEFDKLAINTPGVRLPDTSANDQQRILTPALALKNGADRLVIGRNLTEGEGDIAERIKRNYARIMENIEAEAAATSAAQAPKVQPDPRD